MLFLLRHSALERIGRKDDKYITQLPRGVLSYLLFRNDVHACAFAESWSVASPATSPVEDHPALLAGFCEWAVEAQRRVVESRRAAVATSFGKDPEEYRLESINGWLPRQLTFEFLYRNAGARMTEIMLLIVVDPRRAVRRRRAETKRRPAELDLPFLPPGTPIVLRDHLSSFDCLKRQPFKMDRRMTTWRRVLAEKYGDKVDIADQLFPDLWAHRINTPSPA